MEKYEPSAKFDTFWACLAYRTYRSESKEKIALVRKTLLLHFIGLLYGGTPYQTVEAFLKEAPNLTLEPDLKSPILHQWAKENAPMPPLLEEWSTDDIKNGTQYFVRTNAQTGKCVCRYTLLFLYSAVYLYEVHLNERGGTLVINQGREEFAVYMRYDGTSFQVFLEASPMICATTRHVQEEGATYRLVRCDPQRVTTVGFFTLAGRFAHYCVVEKGEEAGIYRVLPAKKEERFLAVPLYVFAGNKLAGMSDQEGLPLAFLLDPRDAKTIVAVVPTGDQTFARQCIREELKLT